MKYPKIIKQAREFLQEGRTTFGNRFDVNAVAVSLWESGKREAPYKVLEFCEKVLDEYKICDKCKGKGFIRK